MASLIFVFQGISGLLDDMFQKDKENYSLNMTVFGRFSC